MRVRAFYTTNKMFIRILLSFLSLLLPTVIIGYMVYVNVADRFKREFIYKIDMNLRASAKTIDIYLRTAQETSMNVLYDKNVQTLLRPYDQYTPELYAQVPQIAPVLSRAHNVISDLADQLFVYLDRSKVYTGQGVEDFSTFFGISYRFEKYDAAFWEQVIHDDRYVEFLEPSLVNQSDSIQKRTIPFVIRTTLNGNKAIMVVTIAADTVYRTLLNNSAFASTRFAVFDGNDRLVMASRQDDIVDNDFVRINNEFQSRRTVSTEMKIGGKMSVVTYVKSDTYGWKYYSVTPTSAFAQQASDILRLIVFICAALVVVGVFFSFLFAQRLYSPIRKMRDILVLHGDREEPAAPAVASKKSELERIGAGISRLIERDRISQGRLDIVRTDYFNHVLYHWIKSGDAKDEAEIQRIVAERIGFPENSLQCVLIRFGFKETFYREVQDVDRFVIIGKLRTVIHGLLNEQLPAYVLEDSRNGYICMADSQGDADGRKLAKGLRNLIETFSYDAQFCTIHIGIGKRYDSIAGIHQSYLDAAIALSRCGSQRDFAIVDAASLKESKDFHYPPADEKRTAFPAEDKSGTLVASVIRYIDAHYADNLSLDVIADEAGVSAKYISRLYKEKTGINLTDYISSVRIDKAKELLRNTDSNVQEISERVGIFSRSTFIRLFKKSEGITPNEYRRIAGE
ncbi:helix-turn-helix transcriptional regulator [Paenibacillus cymbidii]|uniref:helix-turn-helix transcriptional regulator n=1 Tax=Paenibacillus cymbidii TaxID=1639034 RepID=UPI001080294C|nr:helix-turn-helix domain-containing protein [Paenibacillus cymbidii]